MTHRAEDYLKCLIDDALVPDLDETLQGFQLLCLLDLMENENDARGREDLYLLTEWKVPGAFYYLASFADHEDVELRATLLRLVRDHVQRLYCNNPRLFIPEQVPEMFAEGFRYLIDTHLIYNP